MPGSPVSDAEQLRLALRDQAGIDLTSLVPADGGESGSTFLAADRAGTSSVLKLSRYREFGALTEVVDKLRARGYPAARLCASGLVDGQAFWLQELLPGTVLGESGFVAEIGQLLADVLRLNDAQAGLGDGGHRLSDHYDFTVANLLTDGAGITGVIDMNPPPLTGDRAFDLATLLFYHYDRDELRDRLRARAREITDDRALRVYLAHMVLRQVDWSLRYHPGVPATRHHVRLARLVEADL
jgi:hypothetical protein